MKKLGLILVGLAVFALMSLPPVMAQDIVAAAPANCKVTLENEHVRVMEVTIKPGETLPNHTHPAYVLYALADGTVQNMRKDGTKADISLKMGQTAWAAPEPGHTSTNTGKTDIRVLLVELKSLPVPAAPAEAPKE